MRNLQRAVCRYGLPLKRKILQQFRICGYIGRCLGLHIVLSIVTNRLAGELKLDGNPGEGTKIQIVLPRAAPLASTAQ